MTVLQHAKAWFDKRLAQKARDALIGHDIPGLERAFRWGADPNARDATGTTLLGMILPGHDDHDDVTDLIQVLLTSGANPNLPLDHGQQGMFKPTMALHRMVAARETSIVVLLLQHGADPNLKSHGRTPLSCLVFDGTTLSMAQALLTAGADPRIPNDDGFSLVRDVLWNISSIEYFRRTVLKPVHDLLCQQMERLHRQEAGDLRTMANDVTAQAVPHRARSRVRL